MSVSKIESNQFSDLVRSSGSSLAAQAVMSLFPSIPVLASGYLSRRRLILCLMIRFVFLCVQTL